MAMGRVGRSKEARVLRMGEGMWTGVAGRDGATGNEEEYPVFLEEARELFSRGGRVSIGDREHGS